jgi:hypothetical protein
MTIRRSIRTRPGAAAGLILGAGVVLGAAVLVPALGQAAVVPGTPGNDVTIGFDNDDAQNTFVQPPGVRAEQHLRDSDLLFGRDAQDLLIGRLGADVLLGGSGHDILVGGPDRGRAPANDTPLGEDGNDIDVWSPGDGSELFDGGAGHDAIVVAPLLTRADGGPRLVWFNGRQIPRVDIGDQPALGCELVPVPDEERLGYSYLLRVRVGGVLTATIRLKEVDRVLCPSADPGFARSADLAVTTPTFSEVPLSSIRGVLGAVVAAP